MSARTGFFSAWWGPRPSRARTAPGTRVRLRSRPMRAPETDGERALVDALTAQGSRSSRALVSFAACVLYRQELDRGGALADIGLFGENLFRPDVGRALEAGRGILWDIEPER